MNRECFVAEESEQLSQVAREMGWDLHYDQRESGRFSSIADYSGSDDTQFFRERYNRALCIHGNPPAGMTAFLLPAHRPEAASFCGQSLTAGTLCAYLPGDQGVLCTPAGYDFFNFSVTAGRIDCALQSLCQCTLAEVLTHTSALLVPGDSMGRLLAAVEATFTVPSAAGEVLDHARGDRITEERVIAALCDVLTAGGPPRPGPLAARNHWRCVRAVRDYAEANLGGVLDLDALSGRRCE